MKNVTQDKEFCSYAGLIFCLAAIMAILMLIAVLPAWAEDGEADKVDTQIGDIVVTATKMSTEVDKIPTNITVITREDLEKYPGHSSALTVLKEANIPGLYFPLSGGGGRHTPGMSARGNEISSWGVKVMINGVEFNRGNGYIKPGRLAIHDVERIEVTKTPSAEHGDTAFGGVINIITRKAKEPVEAKAGLAFTSLGGGNGYSVINGTQGSWDYYLDASMVREDLYQDGAYYDTNNVYTKVDYSLNDDAQLTFHGSFSDLKGIYNTGLTREQFDEDPSQTPPDAGSDKYYEEEQKLGALVYKQQLGAHELMGKMELQASDYKMYYNGLIDGEAWQAHPEVSMTFNHDIGGMANKFVVGTEYRYHEVDTKTYTASSFSDVGALNKSFTRKDISYAGYLQDELLITNALTVSAGIRYDYFDLEQTAHTASSSAWEQEKGDFSPKLGFTYQLCDQVNLFAGFNSGIKSPIRIPQTWTNGELDPEKMRAYEVGLRGFLLDELDYNIALFWQEVEDKFVRESADPDAVYENAGSTSSKGVELGVNARLPHGFYASTSFTYQKSEFDEFVSRGVDYSGKNMVGVPDIMFSFKLGYANRMLGDISINPVYTGKRYFNYANTNEDDAFWVLNARYAKKIGRFELYVAANNLFDESAVGSGSGNPGNESLYPITGFNTVVGLNAKF